MARVLARNSGRRMQRVDWPVSSRCRAGGVPLDGAGPSFRVAMVGVDFTIFPLGDRGLRCCTVPRRSRRNLIEAVSKEGKRRWWRRTIEQPDLRVIGRARAVINALALYRAGDEDRSRESRRTEDKGQLADTKDSGITPHWATRSPWHWAQPLH